MTPSGQAEASLPIVPVDQSAHTGPGTEIAEAAERPEHVPSVPVNPHAAPWAPFDAGWKPFAGPGGAAIIPGRKARPRKQAMAAIYAPIVALLKTATYGRQSYVTDDQGFDVNAPAERVALDLSVQNQGRGYDPAWIPSSTTARPWYPNVAYEPASLTTPLAPGVPSGVLGGVAPATSMGNITYSEPPDPVVSQLPASAVSQPPVDRADGGDF